MIFSSSLTRILIATLVALGLAVPAFAQTPATTSTIRKETIQKKIDTRKEDAQGKVETLKERMATREAALKAKLQTFRDKKKAEVADRINTNLNKINAQRTEQMLKNLNTMSKILARLETRVNSSSADIKDPAAAKAAIADAKAKIASAEAAVKLQADKDYTLTISSETKAKTEAQATREQLHSDLKSNRQLVIDAKKAVANAIRIAKGGASGRQ